MIVYLVFSALGFWLFLGGLVFALLTISRGEIDDPNTMVFIPCLLFWPIFLGFWAAKHLVDLFRPTTPDKE